MQCSSNQLNNHVDALMLSVQFWARRVLLLPASDFDLELQLDKNMFMDNASKW